jgi:carboxypeptidase T
MKFYPLFSTWSLVIGVATASRPSTVDRSTVLLRNRPPGKFRLIDAKRDSNRNLQSQNYSTIDGYTCFRDLDGMTQAMFDLEANHPDLVSIEDIGDSYLKSIGDANGRDIYVMKITASTSSDRAQVFFTGGAHARELAPPELLMRFAEELVDGYDDDADITWILDTTQINIVLHVNPDGRSIAETQLDLYWRKNVNPNDGTCSDDSFGTDLNRNYDWMWGDTSGASDQPCDEDYCGSGPASEPEVQAIVAYAKSLFPEGQRKDDPVGEIEVPFGENITGLYMVSCRVGFSL